VLQFNVSCIFLHEINSCGIESCGSSWQNVQSGVPYYLGVVRTEINVFV
jgi:hypothetical protein